ncbi:MAG: glycosyltransferase family 4 protein [Candidatus Bathyarchaeota archaeon]|nr:glycosyltransferase family 4 protein [Candidatus Bathyarchaeota archaeon]
MLNYEYPPIGGGAGNATYNLLKEFSQINDISIDLVTSSATNDFKKIKIDDNIKIYKLPVGKGNLHYWKQREILSYSIKAYKQIKKMIEQKKYNLIHAFFGIPCGAIAYLYKNDIPYIISLRGSDVPGFNKRFSFQYIFLKPIIKHIWRNAVATIANSQGLKKLALKTDKNAKIDIINNGVNIKEFSPKKDHKKTGFIVLTVSRLIERKGIDYFIKAIPAIIKKHRDITIRIIGEGNRKKDLMNLAQKLKVFEFINFLGYVPHNEVSNYYSSSDIFVLPSKNEGMSNTILEAMASGLPIITTDTGGTQELIDGNGIIIPREDSDAISNAVLKLINDRKMIEDMGNRSREIAECMSWKHVAKKYLDLYNNFR